MNSVGYYHFLERNQNGKDQNKTEAGRAEVFNVVPRTVYLWCEHGHLQKWKMENGTIRITETSVERLLKEGFARGQY